MLGVHILSSEFVNRFNFASQSAEQVVGWVVSIGAKTLRARPAEIVSVGELLADMGGTQARVPLLCFIRQVQRQGLFWCVWQAVTGLVSAIAVFTFTANNTRVLEFGCKQVRVGHADKERIGFFAEQFAQVQFAAQLQAGVLCFTFIAEHAA